MYKLYGDLDVIGEEIKILNDFQAKKNLDESYNIIRYSKIINKVSKAVFSIEFLNCDMAIYSNCEDIEHDINSDLNEEIKIVIVYLKNIKDKNKS